MTQHKQGVREGRASGFLQRFIFNGLFSTSLFLVSANAQPAMEVGSHAYAFRTPFDNLNHITPLHALRLQDMDTTAHVQEAVQAALTATNLMPDGQHALLNLDLDFLAIAKAQATAVDADGKPVQIMTADGSLLPDQGIWLDQGIAAVQQRVRAFFTLYRQAGGKVDMVALEYSGLSLTADELHKAAEASGSVADYLAAIEADPRFAEIQMQLGFTDLASLYAGDAQAAKRQQRWNALMKQLVAAYLKQAFHQPLAAIFPQAQVTARDYYRQAADFKVPNSDFANTTGANAGNAQGQSLSGTLPATGLTVAGKTYPPNAFNAFRYETNRLRGAALSSLTPVFPTLTAKSQAEADADSKALLTNSDLYQEMVLHAGLAGARQFIYQNQHATAAEETQLDNTLAELDHYVGKAKFAAQIDNLVDWQQPFVLSSAIGDKGKVWRFTPRLDADTTLASTIRQVQPATFQVDGTQITLPNTKVVTDATASISQQGVWATAVDASEATAAGCATTLAVGQECTAYYAGDQVAPQANLLLEKAAPTLTYQAEPTVLFAHDWKSGGADAGVGRDHFTVQYNANLTFPAGTQQLAVTADDAVKVWVDGALVLDGATTEPTPARTLQRNLNLSGKHQVRMEYTDLAGAAAVSLRVQVAQTQANVVAATDCSSVPAGQFCGEYFANATLSDAPVAVATTPAINFNWGVNKPLDTVPADNFSVRWVGDFDFEAGAYTFSTVTDDGVRLWVDDELVIDMWKVQSATTYRKSTPIKAGKHRIKMEYYDSTSTAVAKLSWAKNASTCDVIPTGQYCAEYFNNVDVAGDPVKVQNEAAINYAWKDMSPAPEVNADNFSVRWQGDFDLAGDYRFIAQGDDRIRVWVDGKIIIDAWTSSNLGEYFSDQTLAAGKHRIRVEMREYGGYATAKLFWEQRSDCSGVPDNAFCGSFFDGETLSGDVKRSQTVSAINFDWGVNRPMHGVKTDAFSARWLGNFDFPQDGYYRFNGKMDDGVRVWVDDALVVDQWRSDGRWPYKFQVVPYIKAGKHQVKVEYHESYGTAAIQVNWALVDGCGTTPENAFCMAYFDNKILDGLPRQVVQTAPTIDYAWGTTAPTDAFVGADNYSVRWVGKIAFDEGLYRFVTDVDDSVRIWVDGELFLDAWTRTSPNNGKYRKLKPMTAGLHDIKVEYFESSSTANAKVFWEKAPDCANVPLGKFCASFYDGNDLTKPAVDTRLDDAINFDWGVGSALPNYLVDNFAVSWVGDFNFESGQYTFTSTTDDGVRVWLDNELVIDSWKNQAATLKKSLQVAEGKHRVRMEYYEKSYTAVAKLTWAKNSGCATIPTGSYCAEYYNNNNLTDDPVKIQNEAAINYEWLDTAPVDTVSKDNFSVRWQGDFELVGNYRFLAQVDDGLRLWVDGKLLLDTWNAYNYNELYADVSLAAGKHRIKMEMREIGGNSRAKLSWEEKRDCSGIPDNVFCGSFFKGEALEGDALRTQQYPNLNFDWATNRPLHSVPNDLFSARWVGNFDFDQAGYYRFNGEMDDGVRMWVDDILVINQWKSDGRWPYKFQVTPYITAGKHVIKVEYHDSYGTAKLKLNWALVDGCGVTPDNAFCMSFFDNKTLDGFARQVVKTAPTINYDWGTTAPTDFIGGDHFSVRWIGNIAFEEGTYRFISELNDGAKVWVDGELLIDGWAWAGPYYGKYHKLKAMTAGLHQVKVEYFEYGSAATAKVFWEKAPDCSNVPTGKFCASFFDGIDLTKPAVDSRIDDAINFDWVLTGALTNYLVDNFAIRWVGDFDFAEDGQYTFTSMTDDGVRVWLDDELLIDNWRTQAVTTNKKAVQVKAGKHRVRMEYFENGSTASAKLTWAKNAGCSASTIPTGSYCAEYYNNNAFTDDPFKIQNDAAVNFNWGAAAPLDGMVADNFSVRWQGDFELEGDYRFVAQVDDGIRVWLDGQLIIDQWSASAYIEYFKDLSLVAGKHRIKVEMREAGGSAAAKLFWEERHECSGIPDNQFCGEFFDGTTLTGSVIRSQLTPSINFDWGANRPMHAVKSDSFSARWQGKFNFNAGFYRFVGDADDGMRVWIDDVLVIDHWSMDGTWLGKVQSVPYVAAGSHVVKVEYREGSGTAKAKLGWEEVAGCATTPDNLFCMELYNSADLTGFARQVMKTDSINFDWAANAPDPMVSKDYFSVRWTGNIHFDQGQYRFLTDVDDGVKIWIDGELFIDAWRAPAPWYGKQRKLKTLTAGLHKIKVEYRETGGSAKAKVWWEATPDCTTEIPQGKFCGSFFNTRDLTGNVADNRYDDAINFDWGTVAPQSNVFADNFSARWQGKFDFAEGEYTFTARSDDGVRLWIDGVSAIDAWKTQSPTTYTKRLFLTGGLHTIKMEYYDYTSTAVAQLSWKAEQLNEPQIPANLRTATLAQDKVVLAWDTQPIVTQYKIYKDADLLTTTAGTTTTDTAVTAVTSYTYKVTALWPNGKESRPAVLSVTIPDTQVPTAPTKLAVQALTPTSVTLAWTAATDNVAVKSYQIWRNNVMVAETSVAGFVDSGLKNTTKYSYKVMAVDTSGNVSPASTTLSVTTKDSSAPTVPTGLAAEVLSAAQISLTWQPATDNVGVTGYRVLRDGVQVGTSTQPAFIDTTIKQDTLYRYQVVAVDAVGNASTPSAAVEVISGDATAPSAPPNLTAKVTADQQVHLEWNAATDNKAVVKYRVIRDGRVLGMTDLLGYNDATVQKGQSYTYSVKALDAAGNASLDSNTITISVDGICESTQLYYKQNVESVMANCTSCHVAGGMATNSRLILSTAADATNRNLGAINTITQILGKQTVLDKVSAKVAHGGGAVLSAKSNEYAALGNLLTQLASTAQCTDVVNNDEPVLTESLAANCFSCHGSQGASAGPGTPGISGMSKSYLNKVLTDYQTGARASTVMARMVKGFSADELSRLADYFSQQPYVASTQTTDSNLVTRGQVLHEQYCASCHTANGRDANLTGARLAGQWKPYLHATLKDYVKGRSQATTGMSDQVRALYNAEGDNGVAALAEFYASNSQDTQAPEKPSDLDAVSYTPTSTTLTWTDSNDDWGVLYYDIYRDGVWVGRTRFNSYTDSGLKAGHYTYTVVAVDIFGNQSVVSDSVSSVITSDEAAPDGVQLLNFPDTLRKASVVLLNRLPTQAELDAAKTEDGFRTTLRQMMDTKGAMDAFVYRAGHETFLSVGAAGIGSSTGLVGADFPNLLNMTQTEVNAANDAVRKEPVYLLQYMVGNDKPWTDALTANYTVMNPQLTKATAALTLNGAFTDPTNAKELRPVRIPFVSARYPSKAFAHAGVLSTNAWLSRFPTTDTNRNRHRAAKVYKQFLGVDIETLAQRPLDDSKNGNYRVPTMQNPNCMVCHTLMEPVAGAFRDWGANSWYLQNYNGTTGTKDSLSSVYKSGSYPLDNNGQPWYHTGDTWYRDMFPTGFNNRTAPGGYSSFGGKTWTTTDNLLASPSAETGVTGWVVNKGKLEATNKTTCSKVPLAPRTGTYLYQLGSCATTSDETLAWQDIDITSSATLIDQAKAEIDFGAYFNALNGQDTPSVWVEFLDKSGVSVGKSSILTDKTSWTWVNKTATQVVPKNTRKLRFTVQGLRSTQTWADKFVDAYVDDLFLVLRTPDKNMLTITGTQDNLQWLGKQLIQDPRFAKGGVYFWFKPLFKRDPLKSPVDTSAANYATQMAAYNAQDELLEQMAKRFAYDQGHGAWNVKDLLIDMTASPLFRAKAGELSTEQEQTLSDSGLSRLLTPEELNAKVKSLTNYDWSAFRQDNAWWYSMGLFYGGFDGGRYQNKPNTDMNSLMSNIPERMAIELSCNAVADDFRLAAGSRKLFPFVEATDTPVYEEVDTTALNLLVNPGAETGMEGWSMEQGTARILAGAVGCDGGPSIKSGKAIFNPGSICVNPTPLGLMYQKVDLTAWDQEIDAGTSKVLFGAALRGWSTSNDEASVYLSFRDISDNELAKSPVLSGKEGYWKTEMAYAMIPAGTRSVRFYLQGKRIDTSTIPNNDSFIDDTYLRVVTPSDNYMPAGERRVRSNLQYLYRQFLNEKLAIDDPEITRSFNLFSEVWTNRNDTTDVACRLYSSWEDPNYTKRAWGVVMMYLMNDARFLYE